MATGKILSPLLRETRTEEDFLENLDNLLAHDRQGTWRIVVDNLNTHYSESCVRYIAAIQNDDGDLGRKGARGILKSTKTRKAFLSDPTTAFASSICRDTRHGSIRSNLVRRSATQTNEAWIVCVRPPRSATRFSSSSTTTTRTLRNLTTGLTPGVSHVRRQAAFAPPLSCGINSLRRH